MRNDVCQRTGLRASAARFAACVALFAGLAAASGHEALASAAQPPAGIELMGRLSAAPTLTAPDGAGSLFGRSLSLSADGATAIVGAPTAGSSGSASIYSRSGSVWTNAVAALSNTEPVTCAPQEEEAECRFGSAVALSGDGSTALVGVPGADGGRGAVWVFTRSAGSWTRGAELQESEPGNGFRFGRSLALSFDGRVALIGGAVDRQSAGAAWVFTRSGGAFSQQGERLGSPEAAGSEQFARSVALSSDGATALIGAPSYGEKSGGAWIFARSGESWAPQTPRLTSGEPAGEEQFGRSVALSRDGTTALIGAPDYQSKTGAAWVFNRSGVTWSRQTPALRAPGIVSRLGSTVALSGDGAIALIGAPGFDSGAGAVWEFGRSGTGWSQDGVVAGAEGTHYVHLGSSLALSADGTTGLAGASSNDLHAGGVWSLGSAPPGPAEPPPSGNQPPESPGTAGPPPSSISKLAVLASGPEPSPPVLDKTGNLLPISGTVLVKLPGGASFVAVKGLTTVPFGTVIDATLGKVTLTTIGPGGHPQRITFYGGSFLLLAGHNGRVIAVLAGGSFATCPTASERAHRARISTSRSARSKVVRKLWAVGHGSYSTKGTYAAGAVQGTKWLTEDRCDGTLIFVATDRVAVTNLVTGRHRRVRAHHSYFAPAP